MQTTMNTVHVKPTFALSFFVLLGIAMMIMKPYMMLPGLTLIILSLFALAVMPDRLLCTFTPEYLVLYNCKDRAECNIIYWDEIVSWTYEWHPNYDQLVINLTDGRTELQDMYSPRTIRRQMRLYAKDKEKKARSRRKAGER